MLMMRYPNGVEGEFFHQKRVPVPHPDWLETVHVRFPSGRSADFPVVEDAAGLAWIVDREPRLHRAAHVALARLRRRAARLPADRPRPVGGQPLAVERRVGDQSVATTTWKVADRTGVFVDYGQNARDRTIASAYSIRPTHDARVSAPPSWDEVPRSDPADHTLLTMRDRIAALGDLTAGMWRRRVTLASRLEQLGVKPTSPRRRRTGRSPERWLSR
jgi:bifunctional non-homologous end joining protein LigD